MALRFMYITNRPEVALIAEEAGVEMVWVDMEHIGKDMRQRGMNTVQCCHTVEDVANIRQVLTRSKLLVRINSPYEGTAKEIEAVLAAGADVIMLPYFKTTAEAAAFLDCVNGRAETILLFETPESVEKMDEILALPGVENCHIGLNDLHLGYGQHFLFEPLADGTVDRMCQSFRKYGKPYGFGGIARLGMGQLPSELVLSEHVRLGSSLVILSRSFCNVNQMTDTDEIRTLFLKETAKLRAEEERLRRVNPGELEENRIALKKAVKEIVNA